MCSVQKKSIAYKITALFGVVRGHERSPKISCRNSDVDNQRGNYTGPGFLSPRVAFDERNLLAADVIKKQTIVQDSCRALTADGERGCSQNHVTMLFL